jgi:hypothetical protein
MTDRLRSPSTRLSQRAPGDPVAPRSFGGARRQGRARALASLGPVAALTSLLYASAITLASCGVAPAPIAHPQYSVPAPVENQVTVTATRAPTVGGVTPVYIAISNGDQVARRVVPRQIFAVSQDRRVAAIAPGEAARMAGGANELIGVLESGAVSGAAGGALGAGVGALAGAFEGGAKPAALIGGAVGAGWGAFEGAPRGAAAARRQANQQLKSLALRPQRLDYNFSASGYVFFPSGNYNWVEVLLVNVETGRTESYRALW